MLTVAQIVTEADRRIADSQAYRQSLRDLQRSDNWERMSRNARDDYWEELDEIDGKISIMQDFRDWIVDVGSDVLTATDCH